MLSDVVYTRLQQLKKEKTVGTREKRGFLCQIWKNILLYGVVFYEIV